MAESPLSWNAQGPAGPPGPQGPAGDCTGTAIAVPASSGRYTRTTVAMSVQPGESCPCQANSGASAWDTFVGGADGAFAAATTGGGTTWDTVLTLYQGEGIPADRPGALAAFERGCEGGDGR